MADDNRHHMMESLFGAESGESDDEPSAKPSYSTSAHSANSARDDDEGDAEGGGEAEVESYADGAESERAVSDGGHEDGESEAERAEGSDRDEGSDREALEPELSVSGSDNYRGSEYMENEVEQAREASDQGDDDLGYDQGSEQGADHMEDEQGENEQIDEAHYEQHEDELEEEQGDDVGQAAENEEEEGENEHVEEDEHNEHALVTVPDTRDVFGDSDEDEEEDRSKRGDMSPLGRPENSQLQRVVQSDDEQSEHEGENAGQDVVPYDDAQYDSDDYHQSERKRPKPVGPPLDLDVPLRRPPGRANQLNLVRVSNIMGIESKPFDPKTYEEESSTFVTDADGRKQRLRLEENVVRWRMVKNRDGTKDYESNARFVRWSDGSLQLFLGGEVLDIAMQDARQDQSHLFMRHPKMVLQSQGRLAQKMKFMPSSLSSKSHKLLTALVDSRNKKVLKVKSVYTTIDPDKEKEVQEKAVEQRIRSKTDLQRKQDKITRKYIMPATRDREAQLSPGYLEGALEEEEELDDYDKGARRGADTRRFQQQMDAERGAERRIMNSKRQQPPPLARRPPVKDRRPPQSRHLEDSEEEDREESEYETDPEDEGLEAGEEAEFEDDEDAGRYSDRGKDKKRKDRLDEEKKRRRAVSEDPEPEQSPPRKSNQRRRRVVDSEDEDD